MYFIRWPLTHAQDEDSWFEAEVEEVEGDDYYTVYYHEYDDSVTGQYIDDIRPVKWS